MTIDLLRSLVGAYKDNTDKVLRWLTQTTKVNVGVVHAGGFMRVDLEDLLKAASDLRGRSIQMKADIKWSFEYALQLRELVTTSHEKEEMERLGYCLPETMAHRCFNVKFRKIYDVVCNIKAKDRKKQEKQSRKSENTAANFPVVRQVMENLSNKEVALPAQIPRKPQERMMIIEEEVELFNLDMFAREALTLDSLVGRIKEYWELASGNPLGTSLLLLGLLTHGASNWVNNRAGGSKINYGIYQSTLVGAMHRIRTLMPASDSCDSGYKPTVPSLVCDLPLNGRSEEGYEGIRAGDVLPFMETCLNEFLYEYKNQATRIAEPGKVQPHSAWFPMTIAAIQNPRGPHDTYVLEQERRTIVKELCWNTVQALHRSGHIGKHSAERRLAEQLPLANVLMHVLDPKAKKGTFQLEFSLNMAILLETSDSWLCSVPVPSHYKRDLQAIVSGFAEEVLAVLVSIQLNTNEDATSLVQNAHARIENAKGLAVACRKQAHDLLHSMPWSCATAILEVHDAATMAGLSLCNVGGKVAAVIFIYISLRLLGIIQPIWLLEHLVEVLGPQVFGQNGCPSKDLSSLFSSLHGVVRGGSVIYGAKRVVNADLFPWTRFPHLDFGSNQQFREFLIPSLPEIDAHIQEKIRQGKSFVTGNGFLQACYTVFWPHFNLNDQYDGRVLIESSIPGYQSEYRYANINNRAQTLPTARLNLLSVYNVCSAIVDDLGRDISPSRFPELVKLKTDEWAKNTSSADKGVKVVEVLLMDVDQMLRFAESSPIAASNTHHSLNVAAGVLNTFLGQYTVESHGLFEWKSL